MAVKGRSCISITSKTWISFTCDIRGKLHISSGKNMYQAPLYLKSAISVEQKHLCRLQNSNGVGRSIIWMTHTFLSRRSLYNSTMAPSILVDSINDTRTI